MHAPTYNSPTPAGDDLGAFERLLAELSARFVNLPAADVDAAITDALRQIVLLLDVDRAQLIRLTDGIGGAEVTHSWAVDGVPVVRPKSIGEYFPWGIARVRAGERVMFRSLDELPPEAAVDRMCFKAAGARSNLTMPMKVAGNVEGALTFGCLRRERDWPQGVVERIGVLADVFANALAHKRAREALDDAIGFERVVSNVLAALLVADRSDQDRLIEAGLRDVACVLRAERATLWQRVGDAPAFRKTHRWIATGLPLPPDAVGAVTTPWISTQLVAGAVVRFARQADLPPEAAADMPGLQALQIRAGVIVPVAIDGAVVGALSFALSREDREWPEALVPRVRLLGDVFASVLARQAAERREREAQAQAAHAARVGTIGMFAASLVHELTQPLAASLANAEIAAELLGAPSPDFDELRATVADIVADDRRAGELIQQLRRFLRRGDVDRIDVDLHTVVGEAVRLVANSAADKGIDLVLDVPDSLPSVVANRVQIQQVLLNLMLNGVDAAASHAPRSGRVTLRAYPSEAGVTIDVTDDGPGMDEQTVAQVFQPFFTTKPGGMGLGLSISRTIVSAHGGTLSAHSTPGQGATLRIELPLRPPEGALPAPPAVRPAAGDGTVYVIEDDASMRRAIERQLTGGGYRVETFATAREFLARPPQAGSACIVSDVRMPGLSGLDLQASLTEAQRDLPIVFISGHGDVAVTAQAMKAGAVNFLAKPFGRQDLLNAVAEALARDRARDGDRRERAGLQARYDSLTRREREVLALVAAGLLNKVIADRLGAAEATVKIHRGRVMEKMGAASVADLVRMVERLRLTQGQPDGGADYPRSAPSAK